MPDQKTRWILKDADGRVRGPYSTEKIIHKINSGDFNGEEFISHYPGGRWFPISQEPQFYDRLLDVLSGQSAPDDETLEKTKVEFAKSHVSQTLKPDPVQRGTAERKATRESKTIEDDTIELVDVKKTIKKEVAKKSLVPLIAGAVVLLIAGFIFLQPTTIKSEDRIHLLAIQPQRPQSSSAEKFKKALPDFLRDTYSGYLRSQDEFVQILQIDAKNSEVLSLLCMTYNELWPYSYQDTQDLRTVSHAVQLANQIDATSANAAICKTVDLLVRGRLPEARSLVSAVLENNAQQTPVLLYYLKSVLLENSSEFQTAIGYVASAIQLWPQWLRGYVQQAQLETKNNNPTEAANIYNRILKNNPDHKVARLELGLLQYRVFRQFDKASELLNGALQNSQDKVSNTLLSNSYFALAEIALNKQDRDKALKMAQQAYSASINNVAAKNLIVQLGGLDKLKKTKLQGQYLMYEGDQLVREGDCQSAQAHYRSAFEEDPKNATAALKSAKCLWQLSLSTEAIDWLNKAIKADSKSIEAYVLLADYYTRRFNFDAASRVLASAQRISPKSFDVYRGFAIVELRRNNPSGAITYAKRAIALYEADADSFVVLAKSYLAMASKENFPLALSAAMKAVEIDINNRDAQVIYAEALAGTEGVEVGLNYLRKLTTNFPLVLEYQIALGKLYLSDDRFSTAEEAFQRIIKTNPKSKEALVLLAKSLRAQNKMEAALDTLLEAAIADPADPEPLFQAALIYLENKKPAESRAQLERVLRVNPSYPLVHYYIGRVALETKKPAEALNQAHEEQKINPNLPEAFVLSGDAYMDTKQYSLAASEYQKSLQLISQPRASLYIKVAHCYRLAGSFDSAASMLDIAFHREPGNANIYKERAQLYEMTNDAQRAIEAYNQYFVLEPTAPDRQQIMERIQALQLNH